MKQLVYAVLFLFGLSTMMVSCGEKSTNQDKNNSSSNSQAEKIQGQNSNQIQSTTTVSIKGYWWCTNLIDNQRQGMCFDNGRFVHFACHPIFGLKEITFSVKGSYKVQGNTIQLVYDDGDKSTLQIDTERYTDVCIHDGKYMMTRTGQRPAGKITITR